MGGFSFPSNPSLPSGLSLPSVDGLGNLQVPSLPSGLPDLSAVTGGSATGPSWGDIGKQVLSGITSGFNNPDATSSKSSSLFGLSYSRIAAFVIGIILIGGGILMFKQTQVIVQGAAKTGARAAELLA
jgi:hypothetical protein